MTIVEFLTARLDEDEADWQMVASRDVVEMLHGMPLAPRMLAEVAAKRRIIDLRYSWALQIDKAPAKVRHVFEAQVSAADAVLRSLAQPYADHPDYNPSWAPTAA